jgi:hypothetical protein
MGRLRIIRRLAVREDGVTLIMAIAVLAFLSLTAGTALYVTTTSHTTTNASTARQKAYALAQAGLSDALAILTGQLDTDGSVRSGASNPATVTTLLSSRTVTYSALGGSVTYSGVLNTTNFTWAVTSTGSVKQQDVSTPITRTLTQTDNVVGLNQGADASSWSRFYQDDANASDCLTLDATTFVTNIGSRGCLVLKDSATITGSTVNVDVGTTVSIQGTQTTTGTKSPSAASAGWTNPTYADATSDSKYATYSVAASNGVSSNLDVTGFNLNIPTTATINGISVSAYRYATPLQEIETISQSGTVPAGGAFAINVCGTHTSTSSMIAYTATAATITSAINTVCGANYVACTGGPLHTATVTCTFAATSSLTLMSTNSVTPSTWTSNKPTYAKTQTGGTVTLKDSAVYLLKAGSVPVGETNKASGSTWPTSNASTTYGSTADLWNTTWAASDLNATNFGVRLVATNSSTLSAEQANVDHISVTVTYTPVPPGIGTSAAPVNELNVGTSCQLNTNTAHSPCLQSTDDVWASTITATSAANNPTLIMPQVDFSYWYKNAKPGPKHFCTNPNPGITSAFFDNDSTMNGSITVNGEMAGNTTADPNSTSSWTYDTTTPNIDYDCQFWSGGGTSGTMQGEIAWNHTTHVMKISGVVLIDGSFRFDNDGQVIHYFGRGDLMSTREDEIDSLVCAGGSGTTHATSCITNMSSWDETTNMMVLMADTSASWNSSDSCGAAAISGGCEEYDQGGSTCSGGHPDCWDGYRPSGFQGILWSNGPCYIHQEFQDSGPVICNRIYVPNENGKNPTFYTFPYAGNLTDGQQYSDTASSSFYRVTAGTTSG